MFSSPLSLLSALLDWRGGHWGTGAQARCARHSAMALAAAAATPVDSGSGDDSGIDAYIGDASKKKSQRAEGSFTSWRAAQQQQPTVQFATR
eukprot:scaffold9726_cov119-Isochrysis_galbana.AAC.4